MHRPITVFNRGSGERIGGASNSVHEYFSFSYNQIIADDTRHENDVGFDGGA